MTEFTVDVTHVTKIVCNTSMSLSQILITVLIYTVS